MDCGTAQLHCHPPSSPQTRFATGSTCRRLSTYAALSAKTELRVGENSKPVATLPSMTRRRSVRPAAQRIQNAAAGHGLARQDRLGNAEKRPWEAAPAAAPTAPRRPRRLPAPAPAVAAPGAASWRTEAACRGRGRIKSQARAAQGRAAAPGDVPPLHPQYQKRRDVMARMRRRAGGGGGSVGQVPLTSPARKKCARGRAPI